MNRTKKHWLIAAAALWALLLLPFFLGAPAAHPATDDFTFAAYTRPTWVETGSIVHVLKDALSYALRTWRDWQGTVTGVIIMTLNPIVFSLPHYGVHAVLLLVLNLAAWFVFLRRMLCVRLGLSRALFRGMYLALSACLLVFLPDMVEGIYWFNGAWFYMGAQAVSLLTLTLCDAFGVMRGRERAAAMGALCAGLLFALGMDNYITAMMTAAALFMMGLQRIWAYMHSAEEEKALQRRAAVRTLLLLAPIGAGLLLSVMAPGNAVRMERDGAHQSGMLWLLLSILWTLRDAAWYIVRFSFKTPLFALLAAVTPLLCRGMEAECSTRAEKCPPAWATEAGFYLILCAMIIPHMYSSGNAGSGRVVNMYHCYVLTALPIAWVMILLRQKPDTRARLADRRAQKICTAVGAAALIVCVLLGQGGNYVKLVSDQIDGTQAAYIAQFENEYALCEAGDENDDVMIPAWTVQTVTGKLTAYEDAAMWTNESMAQYFGVRSVRVGQE
ncbi:MAG: hypothetical protein IJD60_02580 [Clostridia bacterium]|nr:hypothetical protein [Clostridia bacterium]